MPEPLPHFDNNKPTLYDIYRELGELSTKAEEMLANQESFKTQFTEQEKRISKLENGWSKVVMLGSLAALVVTILANTFKFHITQ